MVFGISNKYEADRVQIKWWLLIIILFDTLLPDFFANIFPNQPIASLPFLFFGVLLFAQVYEPSWLTIFLIILFVMFYFIKFTMMGGAFQEIINQRIGDDDEFTERKNPFSPATWTTMIRDWMNQSMYRASGADYYASQVDSNSKKKLGVYIDGFDENLKRYHDNEQIILDATLTAENFVSNEEDLLFEDVISINLSCSASKPRNAEKIIGKVYPKNSYTIETYDSENIQCIFEPWQFEEGTYNVKFNAKFNFKTEAYLKRYFVLDERIDSLKRKQLI